MKLDRRQFLTGCLATAAAGCATAKKGAAATTAPDPNLVALISDIRVVAQENLTLRVEPI